MLLILLSMLADALLWRLLLRLSARRGCLAEQLQ